MAPIDPNVLLRAYSIGVFPMADSRAARDIYWVEPKKRGILPLNEFHLSKSLRKVVRSDRFEVTADCAFGDVLRGCAQATERRQDTWINPAIEAACLELHRRGHAHSIEAWQDGELVGGLYGVRLGAAFFGESMFSRATDASKVALAWLVARLRVGNFRLLDCQFITEHLSSLGAIEIGRDAYVVLLDDALGVGFTGGASGESAVDFGALDRLLKDGRAVSDTVSGPNAGRVIAQLLGQTS